MNSRIETIADFYEFPEDWENKIALMYQDENVVEAIISVFKAPPGPHMTNEKLLPLVDDFKQKLEALEEE